MIFAVLAFVVGAAIAYRLDRCALALLLDELEAEAAAESAASAGTAAASVPGVLRQEHWVERLPVVGPVLSMVWFSRLGSLWSPERPLPDASPLVALVCGLACAAFALKLGPAWPFFGVVPLVLVLILAAACDLLAGVILDELSGLAFLCALGFVAVTHAAAAFGVAPPPVEPAYAYDAAAIRLGTGLWGVLVVGVGLALLNLRAVLTDSPATLGGGVVKLLLVVALIAGWKGALATFGLAALLAMGPAIGMIIYQNARRPEQAEGDAEPDFVVLPFVPFLAMGAILTFWFGHPAVADVYVSLNNRVVAWITSLV